MQAGVSGGHVNPAISIGVWVGYWNHPDFWSKTQTFIVYLAGEVVGMIIGCLICFGVAHKSEDLHMVYPTPAMLCPPNPSWHIPY